ncbi:Arginine biosynthesis bifunctional protein ArgJ [Stieleria maiorica]|uniref:Arginine biosynthesis bifunctional protein ArgJ n=1 Tax=Stieleria maiorica TaxID=2795974 RepID=A0A5B9MH35_9BACT|nr:bifunctional glutamate N-acetyltransferase/amino-acid acetyltransferase ArgJ [Stieleria maiorica]QEF99290.1 Arginine biosynthesis bifunctional protein ArgJ [Stieleria maiorica]
MTSSDLPAGFRFAGVACGIKPSGKPDLSLIVGDHRLVASGVYTQNQVVAAPVEICRSLTPSHRIRAVVTNSGNANACTGRQGHLDAAEMCRHVADAIGATEAEVLVMSTGIIGKKMPMDRVNAGIDQTVAKLGRSIDDFHAAADAILTTDVGRKADFREVTVGGQSIRIAAMAKGAGMISPNLATMLAVVMTDAQLDPQQSQRILREVAAKSFNCVSVDGHTSTNDTLLLLSSGASNVRIDDSNEKEFVRALTDVSCRLARELVADGEGATHVMKIRVVGAEDDESAATIARTIGASPLVKTAISGGDPNWGRIVSAAGYANAKINPQQTSLKLAGTEIYHNGVPTDFDAAEVSKAIKAKKDVDLDLFVGNGPGTAVHWASDLTVEYVRFNSEYTT